MSHNIDMTNDRANIAFLGSRNDVWHRLGQEMQAGMTIQQWITAAGLAWDAVKVPAIASLEGAQFDHIPASERFRVVEDRSFIVRQDNGAPLGYVSGDERDGYQLVQPKALFDWFDRYIAVDDRFALDVAGSLDGGRRIWATARYNGDVSVAGESHKARLLMSTTFDGSGATINQATMTRVVCQNTLRMAHSDKSAMIRTRHSTRFNAEAVGKELAQVAKSFANYKAIGDAMGACDMAKDAVADFFKDMLDIPRTAKRDEISTRKSNQYSELATAYKTSVQEGAPPHSVWAALQAVTRYVDHDRTVKTGNGALPESLARFQSATFGSGDVMKGKAMEMLLPLVKDRVLIDA